MAYLLHRERSLPVSHQQQQSNDGDQSSSSVAAGMRRRLSSMSLQIHPCCISDTTSAATAWAMRRSKSVSSSIMGGESASTSIRNWWDWGWGWIISRKTLFTQEDLEFNQLRKTTSVFRSNEGNTWKHVFLKLRSEILKIVRSTDNNVGLPRYSSIT